MPSPNKSLHLSRKPSSMNAGASSSNPPPPPPAPPPETSPETSPPPLISPACGFRFHPTDEELVGYYLKRKVTGRPLRVDAIAEIDLYRAEPCELPSMSRLRSRDKEWYFFTSLDRKYSNRSRTNRATPGGYWKTTGKDRPIRGGPHTSGMKKTLVFHQGRAPRGLRTNWVMHEYRLDEKDRDSYVVCRIFQKNGSGPQNGAQYGAPLIEEEWEDEEGDFVPAIEAAGADADVGFGDPEYVQMGDFTDTQDQGNHYESTGLLTADSDGQNIGINLGDINIFLEESCLNQMLVDDMDASKLQGSSTLYNDIGETTGVAVQTYSPSSQNDGYLELKDLGNVDSPSTEESVCCFLGSCKRQMSANGENDHNNFPETLEVDEFFDTLDGNTDSPGLFGMFLNAQDDFSMEPDNFLNFTPGDFPSNQKDDENIVFYDALKNSPMSDPSGFNRLDDLVAYFDSTNDNLHQTHLDFPSDSCAFNQLNFVPEVDGYSAPKYIAALETSEANVGRDASSSAELPEADTDEGAIPPPDCPTKKASDGTLTSRLANMLGSISAPPASAAEFPAASRKSFGQISATNSASSIHVVAGMIQIHGYQVTGKAGHWSLSRNGDVGFLLSYGTVRGGAISKAEGTETVTKMQGWAMSLVLRGGLYLFLLSVIFLAVGFNLGMLVCSR